MAIPKNKNIRKITVDNIQYYWTIQFDEDYGLIFCNVGLIEEPTFRFRFSRGANDSHIRYIHNGIQEKDEAITPKLVAEVIEFANNNLDWKNNGLSQITSDSKGFYLK